MPQEAKIDVKEDRLEKDLGIDDLHRVLDAFHAFERVKKAFHAYHGEGTAESHGAFEEHRKRLKEDPAGLAALLRALGYRRRRLGAHAG